MPARPRPFRPRSFQPLAPTARFFVALLALALVALPAAAQDSGIFGDVIDVNVTNVEVVVLDADGEPVDGLTLADFRLTSNGEPVEISNFYEVRAGVPMTQPAAAQATPQLAALPIIDRDSRSVLLFFDNTSLEERNRKRVLTAARDMVTRTMGANDFFEVAAMQQGGQLRTVQTFTSDRAAVLAALDQVAELPASGNLRDTTFVQLVRDLQQAELGSGRGFSSARQMRGRIEAFARQSQQASEQNLAAIEFLLRPVAGIPGQKAVVFFGEGLTIQPAETLLDAYQRKFGDVDPVQLDFAPEIDAASYDLRAEFEQAIARSQESDVRFYAIDAGGKRRNLLRSAAAGAPDIRSLDLQAEIEIWPTSLDREYELYQREGLRSMAQATGGAMLADTRAYDDFLSRVDRDLNNFYSLGFQISGARDDSLQSLEVELAGEPGYTLLYRQRFQNKSPERQLADLAVSQLLAPVGLNGLGMSLFAGEPTPREDRYVLPLEIRFPADNATLVQQGDAKVGQLKAIVIVQDLEGQLSPAQEIPLELSFTEADLQDGKDALAVAQFALLTRGGRQRIAVALRDLATGVTSAGSFVVDLEG
ncbi:MAG: VWA domain-containing protein [Acidobacteriota bacterium]